MKKTTQEMQAVGTVSKLSNGDIVISIEYDSRRLKAVFTEDEAVKLMAALGDAIFPSK